jgi:hypothetical protein
MLMTADSGSANLSLSSRPGLTSIRRLFTGDGRPLKSHGPQMFWCFRCVRNLLGATIALAGLLALAEVGLRIARLMEPPAVATTESGSLPLAIPSASTGWELLPAARATSQSESGVPVLFRTNSLGLRGDEVSVPKPSEVYRIVCLGDEALLAPGVAEEQSLPGRLQQRLQSTTRYSIEVLNAGLPQGCPETALLHVRLRLLALQPDLVILQIRASQIEADQTQRKWLIRDRQGQTLTCSHPELHRGPRELPVADLRREFALFDWAWTQAGEQWSRPTPGPLRRSPRPSRQSLEQMLAPVDSLAALCRTTASAFVVCLAPANEAEGRLELDGGGPVHAAAFAWLAQRQIAVVDGSHALRSTDDFLETTAGWSPVGHARLADFVASQIVQHLRGPWSRPYPSSDIVPVQHTQPAAPAASRQP